MSVVVALTLYAVFTRTDFTTLVGIIIVVVVCFSVFGILCLFGRDPVLYKLYCAFGAILAGICLIIDTQMIVGGEKNIEISMDDYVLGALILYVDVIRLFLYILRAMGSGKRR
jgi:FtsH-binding integral membrane protein